MSRRELERVEVMGRVAKQDLKLGDAAAVLDLSYRQAKRVWRRYRQAGGEGLKHGNAGRPSNRGKPVKQRRRVLDLIRKKYSGAEGERFGPTLAAEHLAEEDGVVIDHETLRRDVGGRAVEPAAQTQAALPAPGAQAALWRTGADGRKFPRLVRRAGSAGLPDGHGR